MLVKSLLISSASCLLANKFSPFKSEPQSTARNAVCILYPSSPNYASFKGIVSFQQESYTSPTKIVLSATGLKPNSLHAFHIHEFGDLTDGCNSAGAHYNPTNKSHRGPLDEERHVGDLGNVKTDERGNTFLPLTDKIISLYGEQSVIGRSCVIHENEDDLGKGGHSDSKTTGHAGPRIACGVIGLSNKFATIKMG